MNDEQESQTQQRFIEQQQARAKLKTQIPSTTPVITTSKEPVKDEIKQPTEERSTQQRFMEKQLTRSKLKPTPISSKTTPSVTMPKEPEKGQIEASTQYEGTAARGIKSAQAPQVKAGPSPQKQASSAISAAEQIISRAESMSENWGSKIQWGDKTYDLGTTQGYKDFKQAIRDAKHEITDAKSSLRLLKSAKWEAETSRQANEVVERANTVIKRANHIIEQQNRNIEKIAAANKRLIETKYTHDVKEPTRDEIRKQQIDDTYNYLTAFVMQDIADQDKVAETIAQVAPIYVSQGQGESQLKKWMDKVEELKRDAEARANWRQNEGKSYADRMKPENRPTLEEMGARLEHLAISFGEGAAYALPVATVTALGGPIAGGIVVAGTIATFASPKTRYETAVFIGAHPEEFFAGVAGALAAGWSVSKAQSMWNKYKTQLTVKQRQALEAKWDKLIDDYTYKEQTVAGQPSKGKNAPPGSLSGFPNELAEKITGVDPYEEYVFRRMLRGMTEEDIARLRAGLLLEMDGMLDPTFVDELMTKYPELRDPFLSPTFKDPNVLNKANLVARVSGTSLSMTPLLSAALAMAARQGYITEAQIKQLIKSNTKLLELYKTQGLTLTQPWTLQELKNLTLEEVSQVVQVIPVSLTDSIAMQEVVNDTLQEMETITEPVLEPVTEPIQEPPPEEPPPEEIPPRNALGQFIKGSDQGRRRPSIPVTTGKVMWFRVKYSYPHGAPETVMVEARSYTEAMSKAQQTRRIRKEQPDEVNLWVLL